jgi:hypothetical protein
MKYTDVAASSTNASWLDNCQPIKPPSTNETAHLTFPFSIIHNISVLYNLTEPQSHIETFNYSVIQKYLDNGIPLFWQYNTNNYIETSLKQNKKMILYNISGGQHEPYGPYYTATIIGYIPATSTNPMPDQTSMGAFIFRTNNGSGIGDNGNGYIAYNYFLNMGIGNNSSFPNMGIGNNSSFPNMGIGNNSSFPNMGIGNNSNTIVPKITRQLAAFPINI